MIMNRVGFFRTQPTQESFICRFYPNVFFKILRNGVALFIIYFFVLFAFSECDLLGQQVDCSFNTIRLKSNDRVHRGSLLSSTDISTCKARPGISRVSIRLSLSTQRTADKESLCSILSWGTSLPDHGGWQLSPNVTPDEIERTCTITLFCPKASDQLHGNFENPIPGCGLRNEVYIDFNPEEQAPVLLWQQASIGLFQLQNRQPDQFYLVSRRNAGAESRRNQSFIFPEACRLEKNFLKRNRDFAFYGRIENTQVTVIYESTKKLISIFDENNKVIALFRLAKPRLLIPKDKPTDRFILLENKLNAEERINLIFLSMFSQWLVNLI